ncbi:MAG: hypothetical protein JWR74_919 [Polaromonas sp.]|jgi:hypothetical protein|nr:hypothetical protein [Polaromonas sp.]
MNACLPSSSPRNAPLLPRRKWVALLTHGSVAAWLCLPLSAVAAPPLVTGAQARPAQSQPVGQDVSQMTAWIRATRNHHGQPFAIIDKKGAMLHVFDAAGQPRGSSPVLLGLAVGDDSVPGIGQRKMSDIRPEERTTPAGRFASEPGANLQGEDIVWIDYDAAVSMHRVRASNKADRRLERLATPTAADNRISYGCVNVPAAFYDAQIKPVFGVKPAVVYVLPETRSARAVFNISGLGPRQQTPAAVS